MANLKFSADILDDVLFRAGEPTSGNSDFESKVIEYLNRAYRSIWTGGTEFDIALNEDWWWLKVESSLILEQAITTGTVDVTNNNASITFSSAPASSVAGYFFKVDDHADVFRISAHTGGATAATLDTVYTGDSDSTASYRLMKLDYDLASDILKLISPMHAFQDNRNTIEGIPLLAFDRDYPLNQLQSGVPDKFAIVDNDTVRFNRYISPTQKLVRVDYDYLKEPADLTDSDSEEPLVPIEYRNVLADITLYYLLADKHDDRQVNIFNQIRVGLKKMVAENQSRWAKIGDLGMIYPRAADRRRLRGPLRTESGSIIG